MARVKVDVDIKGLKQLSRELKKLERQISRLNRTLKNLPLLGDRGTAKANKNLKSVGNQARSTGGAIGAFSKQLGESAKKIPIVGNALSKGLATPLGLLIARFGTVTFLIGAFVKALQKLTNAIRSAFRNAQQFENAFAEVRTILPGTATDAERTADALQEISTRLLQSPTELAKGFYQVVSAGVSETAAALSVLEASAKAASAGVTDTFTAVDAITTVLNSFRLESSQASRVSDVLFNTVREGKLVFRDLARNVGKVAPFFAQAGLSIEEMTGAIAALTKSGLNTEQSTTALRSAITGILKPSQQARDLARSLGIEFGVEALRAKGLAGFLADVQEKTGGNTRAMATLFGNVRALTAVLVLAGAQYDEFQRITDSNKASIGATNDALRKINDTLDAQWKLLKSKMGPAINEFAQGIRDDLRGAIEDLSLTFDLLKAIVDLIPDEIKKTITISVVPEVGTPLAEQLIRLIGGDKALKQIDENKARGKDLLKFALNLRAGGDNPFAGIGDRSPDYILRTKYGSGVADLAAGVGGSKELTDVELALRLLTGELRNLTRGGAFTFPYKDKPKHDTVTALQRAVAPLVDKKLTPLGSVPPGLIGDTTLTEVESLQQAFTLLEEATARMAEALTRGTIDIMDAIRNMISQVGSNFLRVFSEHAFKGAKESIAESLYTKFGTVAGAGLGAGLFLGLGSLLGGLFGGKDKKLQVKDSNNIETIARNTDKQNELLAKVLNAPTTFTTPNVSGLAYAGVSRQTFNDLNR